MEILKLDKRKIVIEMGKRFLNVTQFNIQTYNFI